MSPHSALRSATRDAHDRVDAAFSRLSLADPEDYACFLAAQARALLPVERALTRAGAHRLVAGWADHLRGPLLRADLADLGLSPPPLMSPPAYREDAAILGGAYVLEGSRLGGAVLRKQVPPGLPRRFLDSVQPPGRWRAFVADLDRLLYEPGALERAVAAALETFAVFEQVEFGDK